MVSILVKQQMALLWTVIVPSVLIYTSSNENQLVEELCNFIHLTIEELYTNVDGWLLLSVAFVLRLFTTVLFFCVWCYHVTPIASHCYLLVIVAVWYYPFLLRDIFSCIVVVVVLESILCILMLLLLAFHCAPLHVVFLFLAIQLHFKHWLHFLQHYSWIVLCYIIHLLYYNKYNQWK